MIMKRYKAGDVFDFKTVNGYRIILWAYSIEKFGDYVRVLPGFYNEIPSDVLDIASGNCSFIIQVSIKTMCKKNLLTYVGSINESLIPEMPKYQISYSDYGNYGQFDVSEFGRAQNFCIYEGLPDGSALPKHFKEISLVNGSVGIYWFIYLITEGFDYKHWNLFYPGEKKYKFYEEKYKV